MSQNLNRQILLKSRPIGEPYDDNFEFVERPLAPVDPGQVLRRTVYLSLDPYVRGRMATGRSYTSSMEIGDVIVGGTVSRVVESQNPDFAPGDWVLGYDGWQEFGLSDGANLRKLDAAAAPVSYWLGVLGMPGLTAYAGLLEIGKPQAGQTVLVSAAAGAVGSVAGQIAKIVGCRVVGSAGTEEKCSFVKTELGFDDCINYNKQPPNRTLRRLCPDGIDVYYDNVAGPFLEAVMLNLALHARIVLVGLISQYNMPSPPPGPNLMPLLVKRAMIQGFLVSDYKHLRPQFESDMIGWLKEGRVKFRQDIRQGLENAPTAFMGLFKGENFGKLIVQVSPE